MSHGLSRIPLSPRVPSPPSAARPARAAAFTVASSQDRQHGGLLLRCGLISGQPAVAVIFAISLLGQASSPSAERLRHRERRPTADLPLIPFACGCRAAFVGVALYRYRQSRRQPCCPVSLVHRSYRTDWPSRSSLVSTVGCAPGGRPYTHAAARQSALAGKDGLLSSAADHTVSHLLLFGATIAAQAATAALYS